MNQHANGAVEKLRKSVSSVFFGKNEVVELALVALLAKGHFLIEDVPGVGKTLVARTLAKSLDCVFSRVQFTPDLLPSDIIGTSMPDVRTGEFHFKKGPLFAHILLADEINRTSPRTQSAFLEAMSDLQVTVDGKTYPLENPFLVIATQNPFEFEGTYALPESQLDRFLLCVSVGYPSREAERRMLTEHRAGDPMSKVERVVSLPEIKALQDVVPNVRVEQAVSDYLLDIVDHTRKHPDVAVGVSPRGSLMLYRAAQAMAVLRGRDYVVPDDIKELAVHVLAHRIVGHAWHSNARQAASDIIRGVLDKASVPG